MKPLLVSFAGALLVVGTSIAVNLQPVAKIEVEAWSPDMLAEAGRDTHTSSGLPVVGVGELTYLRGHDEEGGEVTSYAWSLTTRPSGSTAALDSTSTERTTFRPDMQGQYVIDLMISTADGSSSASVTITAAKYVGVGSVAGATPDRTKGQCAGCHSEKADEWSETGHATMFSEAIDGLKSSHYSSSCIECHTVGYNVDPEADNGGFDDVARALGWMFPDTLVDGNWQDIVDNYPTLAQVSNIQCENCHGPGSQHFGDVRNIGLSIDVGVCAQCHAEGDHHAKVAEWMRSAHAMGETFEGEGTNRSCAPCHSGWGGILNLDPSSQLEQTTGAVPITCAVCHDPHSAENEHQLRTVADVTLNNGDVIRFGGNGRLCMNCHKSRRNAEEYVAGASPSSHFGPHHNNQTDVLAGKNAITFGRELPNSNHYSAVPDLCVGCHMAEVEGDLAHILGGHTWNMHINDPNDPDHVKPGDKGNHTELEHNVTPCQRCHGMIESFDDIMAREDFDKDGEIESAKAEIQGLLDRVGVLLPPYDDPDVDFSLDLTPLEFKAGYNWAVVHEDGSHGLHNFRFEAALLQLSEEVLLYGVLSPGTIAAVKDVPNDQGKQVEVIWTRFGGDGPSDNPIQIYYVWRLSDSSVAKAVPTYKSLEAVPAENVQAGATLAFAGEIWTQVASQPAAQMELYSAIAPTLYDSTSTILVESTFMVSGHTKDSQIYVKSDPATGYSIDNLAPQAPANVAQTTGSTYGVHLFWDDPVDADFNYFEVYRSTKQGFNPNTVLPIGKVVSPEFGDITVEIGKTYYYRVAAYDFAGNRSKFSNETSPAVVTGTEAGADVPESFALHQNYPNPFNPTTSFDFDVPVTSKVTVVLFDVVGRPVRVLIDGQVSAGRHKATIDGANLSSGMYFLRMLTDDGVFERTITLLK